MKLSELSELLVDASPSPEGEQPWLEVGSPRGGVAWTPLHFACAIGDQELVAELLTLAKESAGLLRSDANAPSKTSFQYSPLHIAARFGQLEIAKMLLTDAPPADPNALDAQVGCSPLHLSVLTGDVAIARVLLDDGKASQIPTKNGTTPLELAESLAQQSPQQSSELRQLLVDREAARLAREQLSGWLAAVGMVEYAPQFVAHGFDDPKFLLECRDTALSDGVLDAMGVTKPGHRSKLRARYGLRAFLESLESDEEEDEEDESEAEASADGSDEDDDEDDDESSDGNDSGSGSEEDEG